MLHTFEKIPLHLFPTEQTKDAMQEKTKQLAIHECQYILIFLSKGLCWKILSNVEKKKKIFCLVIFYLNLHMHRTRTSFPSSDRTLRVRILFNRFRQCSELSQLPQSFLKGYLTLRFQPIGLQTGGRGRERKNFTQSDFFKL